MVGFYKGGFYGEVELEAGLRWNRILGIDIYLVWDEWFADRSFSTP